MSVPLLTHL